MTKEEADKMIAFLKALVVVLDPMSEMLSRGGFDVANDYLLTAMIDMHRACLELEQAFQWNHTKDHE